jgi:two-component system NtrC family sensor kinase
VAHTAGLRGLGAAFAFGVMAAWARHAIYRRSLGDVSGLARLTDPTARGKCLARTLRPRVAESAAVVGIVGGHVLLLFSVAFLRTRSRLIFEGWRDLLPILALLGTGGFTLAVRPATRLAVRALAAGPSGPPELLARGLAQARKLPDVLAIMNFVIWLVCTSIGVFYFRTGPSLWATGDAVMQISFCAVFSWGVSLYQRAWHRDSVAASVAELEAWTGTPRLREPVRLRVRMLRDFGLPLVLTVALSLLAALGLYRALGAEQPLREDVNAVSALFASFTILVLAAGGAVLRAAGELSRPMTLLAEAADGVARGDLAASVPRLDGPEEVVRVGESVERMREALATTIGELSAERAGLEVKVQHRTAELSRALDELRRTQAALIHGERLASLGELVAGVAHEIHNPLNAIAGSTEPLARLVDELRTVLTAYREAEAELPAERRAALEKLRRELDIEGATEDLLGIADVVRRATLRSVRIVANLESFARATGEPVPASLEEGLEETLLLLRPRFAKAGAVVKKHFAGLGPVVCRPGELNQVFMNLLTNALFAIESPDTRGQGIEVVTRREGDFAVVIVSDEGPGVPEALRERIFDPFFTTKPRGQGTGLGLSISTDILRRHGGSLTFEVAAGGGARFVCRLPFGAA